MLYEIKSEQEYNDLKSKLETYNIWAKQYEKKNGWTVIPADAVPPVVVTNYDRSAMEVWEWKNNPPNKYFLYVKATTLDNGLRLNKADVHTWMMQSLGYAFLGASYRDNFGGTRVPITVYGNNGKRYVGTYFKSSGDYARIKLAKNQ